MFNLDPQNVLRPAALSALPWIDCGFGTRISSDWPPAGLASLKQIHSDRVILAASEGPFGEGDALITREPGVYLSIRTADCLPLLFLDEQIRAVAAVHAGWRGTAAEIAVRTVEALSSNFGSKPDDLGVAIGPGICGRCYSVGEEVAIQFLKWGSGRNGHADTAKVDLAEVNRRQLIEAGVSADRIALSNQCTYCAPEIYHSYRRDGSRAGRMVSAIAIRAQT